MQAATATAARQKVNRGLLKRDAARSPAPAVSARSRREPNNLRNGEGSTHTTTARPEAKKPQASGLELSSIARRGGLRSSSESANKEMKRRNSNVAEVIQKHSSTQTEPMTPVSPFLGNRKLRSRAPTSDSMVGEEILGARSLDPRNWASASPIMKNMERHAACMAMVEGSETDSSIAPSFSMMMYGQNGISKTMRRVEDWDDSSVASTIGVPHTHEAEDLLRSTTAERDRYVKVCEEVSVRVSHLISMLARRVGIARVELARDKAENADLDSTTAGTTRDETGSKSSLEVAPELITPEVMDVLQHGLVEMQAMLDIALRLTGDFRMAPPTSSGALRSLASPNISPRLPSRGSGPPGTLGSSVLASEGDTLDSSAGAMPITGFHSSRNTVNCKGVGANSVPAPTTATRLVSSDTSFVCPYCHQRSDASPSRSRWVPMSSAPVQNDSAPTHATPVVRPPAAVTTPERIVQAPATSRCSSPLYGSAVQTAGSRAVSTPPAVGALFGASRSPTPYQPSSPRPGSPAVPGWSSPVGGLSSPPETVAVCSPRLDTSPLRQGGAESVPSPADGKVVRVRRRTLRKCWVVDHVETLEFKVG
mmetsp:Transcript_25747/g.59539  ORF Transcript_25747/g.59539 Transcript_25747/m.59539 type:complete len:594 (-) Transcript_25747:75-1856(-)